MIYISNYVGLHVDIDYFLVFILAVFVFSLRSDRPDVESQVCQKLLIVIFKSFKTIYHVNVIIGHSSFIVL